MKVRSGGKSFEIPDERVRGEQPMVRKINHHHAEDSLRKSCPAPKYDSKWEERYAQVLEMEKAVGNIERFWYHPFSMWLPGKVRYTPDFLIQYHGHLQMVEIKGWSKNLRDGMTRLKIAASIFPCYNWTVAKWNGKDFDFIPVEVDPW